VSDGTILGQCAPARMHRRPVSRGNMKIMRIFPRRTNATPIDSMVRIGCGPAWFDECDAVHISVTFTWDLPLAENLAAQWKHIAPVTIGGPATGQRSGDFVPGMYMSVGNVITSRGCPNRCWFCSAWKREGTIRELPIVDGWNVQDDNLLACSESHIRAVFAMLARQKQRPQFTGGLEAKLLRPWHCAEIRMLKPKQVFFAYDTPDDLEPLYVAGKMMREVGFTEASHALRCYVLCGYERDTIASAEERIQETLDAGFTPMAMLYRDKCGKEDPTWKAWKRAHIRPAIIHAAKLTTAHPDDLPSGG
jgi:hypothetical protein